MIVYLSAKICNKFKSCKAFRKNFLLRWKIKGIASKEGE